MTLRKLRSSCADRTLGRQELRPISKLLPLLLWEETRFWARRRERESRTLVVR